jgi:hypothetical protein
MDGMAVSRWFNASTDPVLRHRLHTDTCTMRQKAQLVNIREKIRGEVILQSYRFSPRPPNRNHPMRSSGITHMRIVIGRFMLL